jgi:hypothetical protein
MRAYYYLDVVHLELLLSVNVFDEIIREVFGAKLNRAVLILQEPLKVKTNMELEQNELSPDLSRVLILILLQCSGNPRAIEYFISRMGNELMQTVKEELVVSPDNRATTKHKAKYEDFKQSSEEILKIYAETYPQWQLKLIFNAQAKDYFNLVSAMGVTMDPSELLFPSHFIAPNYTIETFQNLGNFVTIHVNPRDRKKTYVGSLLLIHALSESPDTLVNSLSSTLQPNSLYEIVEVQQRCLVTPFLHRDSLDIEGNYFEMTVSCSIWARYVLECLKSNRPIGSSIEIEKVLPRTMIPIVCEGGMVQLKGVARLKSKYDSTRVGVNLPSNVVLQNAYAAPFADVILPYETNTGDKRFLGIKTKFYHEESTNIKSNKITQEVQRILDHPLFECIIISTYLTPDLDHFSSTGTYRVDHKNQNYVEFMDIYPRVRVATPMNLVSSWWMVIMYSFQPTI